MFNSGNSTPFTMPVTPAYGNGGGMGGIGSVGKANAKVYMEKKLCLTLKLYTMNI